MAWGELFKDFVPWFPQVRIRDGGVGQDTVEGMQSQKATWVRILVLPFSTCAAEPQFYHL